MFRHIYESLCFEVEKKSFWVTLICMSKPYRWRRGSCARAGLNLVISKLGLSSIRWSSASLMLSLGGYRAEPEHCAWALLGLHIPLAKNMCVTDSIFWLCPCSLHNHSTYEDISVDWIRLSFSVLWLSDVDFRLWLIPDPHGEYRIWIVPC